MYLHVCIFSCPPPGYKFFNGRWVKWQLWWNLSFFTGAELKHKYIGHDVKHHAPCMQAWIQLLCEQCFHGDVLCTSHCSQEEWGRERGTLLAANHLRLVVHIESTNQKSFRWHHYDIMRCILVYRWPTLTLANNFKFHFQFKTQCLHLALSLCLRLYSSTERFDECKLQHDTVSTASEKAFTAWLTNSYID